MTALRTALSDYLEIRRALGFKLRDAGARLEKFVQFMESIEEPVITTHLAVLWAQSDRTILPTGWAANLSHVRLFAEYCSGIEPRTEIPPTGILPWRYHRKSPYIFTAEQIRKLLDAASDLTPYSGLRPRTYVTLFGLLAATGIRVSEAVGLERDAVDQARSLIEVRSTKFNKTRLVPVSESTMNALQSYASMRDKLIPKPVTPWFFVAPRGGPIYLRPLKVVFIELSREIGLRGATDHFGPRLHDLRHSFAVRTLLGWYRADQDAEQKLPQLSTYLGHSHPSDTYWYLSAVPELLAEATFRLEKAKEGKRRDT